MVDNASRAEVSAESPVSASPILPVRSVISSDTEVNPFSSAVTLAVSVFNAPDVAEILPSAEDRSAVRFTMSCDIEVTDPSVAVTREVRLDNESAFAVIAVQLSSIPDKSTALIAALREDISDDTTLILSESASTRLVKLCNEDAFA